MNQKLIAQYSDKGPIGQSLGDLLKAELAEKGAGEEVGGRDNRQRLAAVSKIQTVRRF